MAITQTICNSFKQELLVGTHDFTTTTGDTFNIALYSSAATLDASTTAYTATGEISGTGYVAGGKALTNVTPTLDGSTAILDFNDITWDAATFTAAGALIYNATDANRAVAVLSFGGDQTVTSGTFAVQFPTPDSSNAIIRIA